MQNATYVFPAIFLLVFFGIWAAAIVFWILKIIEVAWIPELQFKAAGTDKILWLLLVILLQVIGALVWQLAKRRDVLAAAGRVPPPPAGWYADPSTGGLRWWDGYRWTELRHLPPSAPPPPKS